MTLDCPHGWKSNLKIGNIIFEDTRVNICGGICDSLDLCGIKDCEYYDDSQEGSCFFSRALAHEHTLEGLIARKRACRENESGF